MPRYNPVFEALPHYPFVELDRRKAEVLRRGVKVFDFTIGDPVEPTPAFIRDALMVAVPDYCPYPKVRGRAPVRAAIAGYLQRRYGVSLDPARQILPTAGAKEVVFHLPLLVIDRDAPDRRVVFPDPGYPACARGASFAGGIPTPVALGGDHVFRPWELPESVLQETRLLWINSPHNPSGAVTPLEDLERTVELCRAHDILLVADETYADIWMDAPPPGLLEVTTEGVLVLHSLSKRSGMTGYRSGFVAGDAELIAQFARLRSNPGLVPQDFVNAAATAAWQDDAHAAARREVFAAKKRVFLDFFEEVGIESIGDGATIYLWVKVPDGSCEDAYARRLLDRGLALSPGHFFGISDGAGAGYLRLAMVPSIEDCRAAVALWREML